MNTTRIELLAIDILTRLKGTQTGHCARVDYLDANEAEAICQYIRREPTAEQIETYILTKQPKKDAIYITVDKAIELRNRKKERLCLFVPGDLVDAAYSSLANSFAIIDGRPLHSRVLRKVQTQLPDKAKQFVKAVFSQLRGVLNSSDDQKMDFALAVLQRTETGEIDLAGLELWRVGLIADATVGRFTNTSSTLELERKLEHNRRCTLTLSRPAKIDTTTRERIQNLKVDASSTNKLGAFFRRRSLNAVRTWSQDLAEQEDFTFDHWIFPEIADSDIQEIKVVPFVDVSGVVEKYCHLQQPDGVRGSLIARCAPKEKLVVRWKSEPQQPKNLGGWHIAMVPSGSDIEYESSSIELPEKDLPAARRNITINMHIEFDEQPDFPVCIHVTPLNTDGTEIVDEEGNVRYGESSEFFLSKAISLPPGPPPRESKFVVPHLAYGRLGYAIETKETVLDESEPQWSSKDLEYFSLKLNDHRLLQVGMSATLLELERQTIAASRKSGCYILDVDDVHTVGSSDFVYQPFKYGDNEAWTPFWKARDLFFQRLRDKTSLRDVVEIAEWTPELIGAAIKYVQAYRDLIEDLYHRQVDLPELQEALSIDEVLIRIAGRNNSVEEAVVTLPIHPLRVAWLIGYTQLLLKWENQLLELPLRQRKYNLDLQALRLLTPINVPAFTYHCATATVFTFFQNLRFFHGVALPTLIPDPHRRYGDVALLFGMTLDQGSIGDAKPEQLAAHLKNFLELHPYTNTLVATLINPDRGDFFAEAMKHLLSKTNVTEDEEISQAPPAFRITAYTDSKHKSTLQAIKQVQPPYVHQQYSGRTTDHFLPAITTISREFSQLNKKSPPEAHIAVITDLTQPFVKTQAVSEQETNGASSFALYGLVNRFISQFSVDQQTLFWQHRIVTEGVRKPEPHPASAKYSEILTELHTALLNAGGYLLGGEQNSRPVLEVRLSTEYRLLLEKLHESTNWIITLDRFFTLDYYDSPYEPGLNAVADKYILDYSPEFTDGLGHRMMVTTAWHEEIQSLLKQAMVNLGFTQVDQSVNHLLRHLKTISGHLALQALESPTTASTAVGLGVVTSWLQKKGRLKQGVLIPVDTYPRLFSLEDFGKVAGEERRCDLVLISLKRNIVDATFIKIKWRRGHVPFEELAKDMVLQMKSSAIAMRTRFFNESRVDGALQRSYLATVLRFYFERSHRYKLFDVEAEVSFLEHISRLEKTGLDFRPNYEGYIVSLEDEKRRPLAIDDTKISILTAQDFEEATEFVSQLSTFTRDDDFPLPEELQEEHTEKGHLDVEVNNRYKNHEEEQVVHQPVILEEEITVPLGTAAGVPVDWHPSTSGSPHLFILGIPGQGKSWTVTRILTDLGKQQVPALVLDFHGQFADPDEPFVLTVNPKVLDAARGLPFSPFECAQENGNGGWLANTYAIAEIFAHVANLGDMQQDVVFTAVRDAYKFHGFRDDVELDPTDFADLSYPTTTEVLQRIEQIAQTRHISNVAARCRSLLEMNLFRPEDHAPDLLSLVRAGLVIDLHNLYAETLQQAVGAFVLRKIYKDMFSWGYAKRIRLAVVLDEAHRLAKDVTLPKLMREGRKFGIAVIVASQGMADFHPDVLGTAGTKVIFRMNFPESKKVAGFIRGLPGQDLAARIEQLPVGSAYVQTHEMPTGSVVKMHPLK